jgi:hypothetical protein
MSNYLMKRYKNRLISSLTEKLVGDWLVHIPLFTLHNNSQQCGLPHTFTLHHSEINWWLHSAALALSQSWLKVLFADLL